MSDNMDRPHDPEGDQLAYLATKLRGLLARERAAKAERVAMELAIADLVDVGDATQKTVDAGDLKITVKKGLNYKADIAALKKLCIELGTAAPVRQVSREEFDVTGYEWYKSKNPEIFSVIAEHVEVKPKKPSVTIKEQN
jgi:hypothetical protein